MSRRKTSIAGQVLPEPESGPEIAFAASTPKGRTAAARVRRTPTPVSRISPETPAFDESPDRAGEFASASDDSAPPAANPESDALASLHGIGAFTPDAHARNARGWLESVRRRAAAIRFGSIQIVIHDGKVTQIEQTEKIRIAPK